MGHIYALEKATVCGSGLLGRQIMVHSPDNDHENILYRCTAVFIYKHKMFSNWSERGCSEPLNVNCTISISSAAVLCPLQERHWYILHQRCIVSLPAYHLLLISMFFHDPKPQMLHNATLCRWPWGMGREQLVLINRTLLSCH